MRRYEFTCDGCDQSVALSDNRIPTGWLEGTSRITSDGTAIAGTSFDLCAECTDRLKTICNPRNWVRKETSAA